MSDNPLEEIAYLPVEGGVLEAIHVPSRYAFHSDYRVRAAYHFGVLRAAREAAAREGYVL